MNEKKGNGCAVLTVLLFLAALGFGFLGLYLRHSLENYHPAPNEPREGDMVSAMAMSLMFALAGTTLAAALYSLLIFGLRRYYAKK